MNGIATPVTDPDAGENLWFGGGLLTIKVSSGQSGGSLLLFEHLAGRGKTTPLHIHADSEESCHVLEGELKVMVDGVEYVAGSGAAFCVPRGVPHAFIVMSEFARSIWMVTPGTVAEAFLRLGGEPAVSKTMPSAEIDIPRLIAAGQQTGAMKVLGPPPFALA